MNDDALFPIDLARVALAMDAMTVGARWPVLVHAETDPVVECAARPFGLFFTPLEGLETIDETMLLLARITAPTRWRLVGLCAPTVVSSDRTGTGETQDHAAWLISVVSSSGAHATRLAVPGVPELSGPTSSIGHFDRIRASLLDLIVVGHEEHRAGRPGRDHG